MMESRGQRLAPMAIEAAGAMHARFSCPEAGGDRGRQQ